MGGAADGAQPFDELLQGGQRTNGQALGQRVGHRAALREEGHEGLTWYLDDGLTCF